jgi:transcriptional regulator HilA, main transcriptional regulator of SPI1
VAARFAFEGFVLDTRERRLIAGGEAIDINARYLDALTLMVRDCGKLIPKDQFLGEVWRGVPVTDEALTQCIKTLRRKLGDDASRPRFIETVPKHGYRFIAPVEMIGEDGAAEVRRPPADPQRWREFVVILWAGIVGGGVAGILGGLVYGLAAASEPLQSGPGALSVLLVLLCVTLLVALIGAAGVSVGVAIARFARPGWLAWSLVAGAAGGLLVGAFGKLLGLDAFTLLVGRSPGNITGGSEGALIGAAVGLAAALALRGSSARRGALIGAAFGSAAGVAIMLLGGRLMLGSLELLISGFPNSRFRLDQISHPFTASVLNRLVHVAAAGVETGLFASCVVGAMMLGRRRFAAAR